MKLDQFRKFRGWLTASLASWTLWTSSIWGMQSLDLDLWVYGYFGGDYAFRMIWIASTASVIVMVLLWGGPSLSSTIKRWGHRQELLAIDFAVITLGVLSGLTWWFGFLPSWKSALFGLASLAALASLALRILVAYMTLPSAAATEGDAAKAANFFDAVLGKGGLGPLRDFIADDRLSRESVVATLEELVFRRREYSLTVGLNGPWVRAKQPYSLNLEGGYTQGEP